MKNLFTFTFLLLFYLSQVVGQTFDNSSECKKLLNHPEIEFKPEYQFAVFTGTETEGIELVELVSGNGKPVTKWIKKKADRNCLSANPEDCLVWCLVEKPGKQEKFQIVLDTTQTDQFKMKTFLRGSIYEMENFFEEKNIPCKLPRKRMSRKICRALKTNGYLSESNCKMRKFTNELAEAFLDFQIDNNLFVGGLSLETLDLLGVDY